MGNHIQRDNTGPQSEVKEERVKWKPLNQPIWGLVSFIDFEALSSVVFWVSNYGQDAIS